MWLFGDELKINIFEEAEKLGNISEICRKYNISRTKYYYYKRKYKNEKKRNEFLRNPSKNLNAIDSDIIKKILEFAKLYPEVGCARYSNLLKQKHNTSLSKVTIQKVLNQNKMGRKTQRIKNSLHYQLKEIQTKLVTEAKRDIQNLLIIRLAPRKFVFINLKNQQYKFSFFRPEFHRHYSVFNKSFHDSIHLDDNNFKLMIFYDSSSLDKLVEEWMKNPLQSNITNKQFVELSLTGRLKEMFLRIVKK
jgi:transposase-like protein